VKIFSFSMAKYDHLTIFQKSYDLMIRVYKEVHNFSREYKYSLGQKIKDVWCWA